MLSNRPALHSRCFPQSPIGRQVLWIISAMILCIVAPLLLHEATGGPVNTRNPWWALTIIVLSGAAYAGVLASNRRQLFAMVLWLFVYIFLGLAPYVQYRLDATLSTIPHIDSSLYPVAGLVVIIGCLAVLVGNYSARYRRPLTVQQQTLVDPRRANMLSVLGIALFFYYGNAIGFGTFLLSRAELSAVRRLTWPDPAISNLLTGGLNMVLLVAFVAQMALREQRKAQSLRPRFIYALVTGLVLLYVVNPISSPRYVFGTVALAVLASLGAYATVNRARIMTAAAMAGMLFLFPAADAFRRTTDTKVEAVGPVTALTTGDFDAFPQIVNTLSYVDAYGMSLGHQLLGVLLFWVPRSVWPGKPTGTGTVVAEHMGYDFTNISSPLWAELFIDFGWIGVVAGLGALGYWFRIQDLRTDLYLRSFPIPPVAAGVLTFYLLIVLRGSLLNAASYLLVILISAWFVKCRPRESRTGSPRRSALSRGNSMHRVC
jgi:hypothetical protein